MPGDAHQFDVEHAAPFLAYTFELVVAHARHHRRDPPLAESLAVDEGLDEGVVHAAQGRVVFARGLAAGVLRADRDYGQRQQRPSHPTHREPRAQTTPA